MVSRQSTAAILRIYQAGVRANRRAHQRTRVWGTLDELGATTANSRNRLMESRRLARLCSREELEQWCHFPCPDRWSFTPTHVLQLLRLKDRAVRRRMAVRCARRGWTTRQLQRQIDLVGLHRSYGGRRPQPPASRKELALITLRMAASWIHWVDALEADERIKRRHLPKNVVQRLRRMRGDAIAVHRLLAAPGSS